MKKLMIFTAVFFTTLTQLTSQVRVDVKMGVSPGSTAQSAAVLVNRDNPFDEFQFSLLQSEPQWHGGVALHLQLADPFFVNVGLGYTKRTSQFLIDYRFGFEGRPEVQVVNDNEEILYAPVNIGVSIGSIDITSGLSAVKILSHTSDIHQLEGFSASKNTLQLGWQTGVRYTFKRFGVGVEYQGSLSRICQGMAVNGHTLEMANVPGKLVFGIQYGF